MQTFDEYMETVDDFTKEWYKSRPECIKELAKQVPPHLVYKLNNDFGVLYSYDEDGTVTIAITKEFNSHNPIFMFERCVFDVKPENLAPIIEIEKWGEYEPE